MKTSEFEWLSKNSDAIGFQNIPYASKYYVSSNGEVFSFIKNKPKKLKPGIGGYGYHKVTLIGNNGEKIHRYVHHLVMENFLYSRPRHLETRHLDGDSLNNKLTNLKYGTHKENENDKNIYGVRKPTNPKLTINEVIEIRKMKGSTSQANIARKFHVSPMTISRIMNGVSWK